MPSYEILKMDPPQQFSSRSHSAISSLNITTPRTFEEESKIEKDEDENDQEEISIEQILIEGHSGRDIKKHQNHKSTLIEGGDEDKYEDPKPEIIEIKIEKEGKITKVEND